MKKTIEELQAENTLLRKEIKVAREAADITARLVVKQFEKTELMLRRFQTANAQLQAVLDAATQLSIISTDLEGKITLFSRGAVNLLGFEQNEMIGNQNIAYIHRNDELRRYAHRITGIMPYAANAVKVFELHVKQKIFQTSEWTYIRKDGTHLPVNLSITPFYNAGGIMKGYLFTAMDITVHKQMENELIQAMKSAEAANASKGDFLAKMSHEIRTPMNGILGMAHLMRKTALSSKQNNYLDKILNSANTLLNLINDILDFSKIDAGKLSLETINFNLNDLLSSLASTIGLQAEEKGLELLFRIDDDVPSNLIGDPLRLEQILINLCSNAVKFTETGEIMISVCLTHGQKDDEKKQSIPGALNDKIEMQPDFEKINSDNEIMLKFSVTDTGIGMLPEQVDFLFQPFSQADDSITRKYGGTGLGLSICRQLTEMMGGKIWVNSSPGKGSTFTMTVKLKFSSETEVNALPRGNNMFSGQRTLVVDDNRAARKLLVSMLRSFGMAVDDAPDGKTALKRLEKALKNETPYNVVLLDWLMPDMDGIETAQRIKTDAALPKTPAMLMVTANGREEAREKAERAGIDAFLLKPVYPSVMYNTLLQTLDIKYKPERRHRKSEIHPDNLHEMNKIKGARVLVVEDNAINQEIAVEFLRDVGIRTEIANNGRECIDILEKENFDLVLMDIQMPEMDGLEATRILRNQKKITHLPIIAMTAHAMTGDRQKSLDAGMNDHINKPVTPEKLYKILLSFIPEKKADIEKNPFSFTEELITPFSQSDQNSTPEIKTHFPPLPHLKGINVSNGLKRLNNKFDMLLTLLNDFKRDYEGVPASVKELLKQKDFRGIKRHAHSVKGVSAYMGADGLFKTASDLENQLKKLEYEIKENPNKQCLPEALDTAPVHLFINEMENVLTTLGQLPAFRKKTMLEKKGNNEVQSFNKSSEKIILDEKAQKLLNDFITALKKGEFTAVDLLPDVESLFKRFGFRKELKNLVKLIDDIEYEKAGKAVEKLMKEQGLQRT